MGTQYDLEALYECNIYKFISALLGIISNILSLGTQNPEDHVSLIKNIVEMYKNHFQVLEADLPSQYVRKPNVDINEQQNIFIILKEYSEKTINYQMFSEKIKNVFFHRFYDHNYDKESDLAYVTGFLLRLYFCLSKIRYDRYLCVVDNIEVFVKRHEETPVTDNQLDTIISGCLKAAKKLNKVTA